jgi:plasmid stabilization system protein ParE
MRVELSRFVGSDLEEIADSIAQDNPSRPSNSSRKSGMRFAGSAKVRSDISFNPTSETALDSP